MFSLRVWARVEETTDLVWVFEQWPAYPDFPYECTIRVADGGNMEGLTRAMLAWRIGVAFYGFVQVRVRYAAIRSV